MAERETVIRVPDHSEAESSILAGVLQDVSVGSADWNATEYKGPGAEGAVGFLTFGVPGARYGIEFLDFPFCNSELWQDSPDWDRFA